MKRNISLSNAIRNGWINTNSQRNVVINIFITAAFFMYTIHKGALLVIDYYDDKYGYFGGAIAAFPFLAILIGGILFFQYGLFNSLIKVSRNEKVRFNNLFSMKAVQLIKIYIATIFITFATLFGLSIVLIPGLFVFSALSFATLLLAEHHDMDVISSLSKSWQATKGNKLLIYSYWLPAMLGVILLVNMPDSYWLFVLLLYLSVLIHIWFYCHLIPNKLTEADTNI